MNNIKRLLFGALSTLLLAAGFVRAADRFDPVTDDLTKSGLVLRDSHDLDLGDGYCEAITPGAPSCSGGGACVSSSD